MNNYKSDIWCGKHTYFDEEGREIKEYPYIDSKIKNTGIGSLNLWCGTHTYFDENGKEIKKYPYIDSKIRNTGIGSLNLWCGKHKYFEENYTTNIIMKPIYIYDLINEETQVVFEEKDIIDLT